MGAGSSAVVRACVDTALYAPTVSCFQLVLNMIFGKLVWQDHIAFPLAYAMVYMLLLLGVYDISTLDLVESWQLLRNADELPALKSASNSIFFQSVRLC